MRAAANVDVLLTIAVLIIALAGTAIALLWARRAWQVVSLLVLLVLLVVALATVGPP